ncbi:hypothetical protein GCM10011521_18230 [Arenimonas soli]|uniref:Sel1 repeat family protein n=1 Tax=Arenimonas soli TaxID=2269504 RepID=A0ABQ1HKA4_9GAMM|nr:SEL1-like repeat protein [Arenimonas soli]GGA80310.1 hypothetical protein GCM10011521_18230 [Arenimonas soli]
MHRIACSLLIASSLALSASPATAQDLRAEEARIVMTSAFLADHPDLKWRKRGLEAYRAGRLREAHDAFVTAARYADKPAQAMLAEMYWRGEGIERDRPRAYAWADLAAERAWPDLLGKREHYWHQLSRRERQRAIEVGLPLLREFGDDAAKPRIESILAQARRRITGSRVGHVGYLNVRMPAHAADPMKSGYDVDGALVYAAKYYKPEAYYAWQEKTWRENGVGQVDIGRIEQEPDAGAE